jgi:hypothetical protein
MIDNVSTDLPRLDYDGPIGCIIIVSEDSDFAEVLEHARRKKFLAVTATPNASQTKKLVKASDIVLEFARDPIMSFITDEAVEFWTNDVEDGFEIFKNLNLLPHELP